MLWYDLDTNHVKIATHTWFDKEYNDITLWAVPPNVVHLHCTKDGCTPPTKQTIPPDDAEIGTLSLNFYITPFAHMVHFTMKVTPPTRYHHLGFLFVDNKLLQRAYMKDVAPGSPAAKISSSIKALQRKVSSAFIISINNHPVFTTANIHCALETI